MTTLPPDQLRAAIEERMLALFSGNQSSLIALRDAALALIDMSGIDSFTTRLPWEIEVQGGEIIDGLSENLTFAARDIVAQLQHMLAMGISAQMQVALSVSEQRLQTGLPSFLLSGVVNA
ncbi:MAG: hypothetical protein V4735_08855 [Pseudomonadota bacterium]